MKIAFDAKRYFNNGTGLGFYSRTLVNNLRRFYPENEYWLYTPFNNGKLVAHDPGLRLPNSTLTRTLHPLWRSFGITAQLKKDGADLFHGLSHELPGGLKKAGIRSVVTVHDLIFMRHPELYPALDRFFYRKKYLKAAREADCVVAISRQTREDLETFFDISAAQVQVIGQSCDDAFETLSLRHNPDRLAFPIPDNEPAAPALDYVMAVGSLTPRKNWHTLLDALFLLKQNGHEMPLLAIGSGQGNYVNQLHQKAREMNLAVTWISWHVPSEALAHYYRRAAMLVYPSIFEGFGIPVLEALTVGIPVVTTRGGCFEEAGGNAALYADPHSAEDIARNILKCTETDTRKRLTAAAPGHIRQFSPENISAQWINTYREVLHRAAPPA